MKVRLVLFALVALETLRFSEGSSAIVDGVWSPSFADPQPCLQSDTTCNAITWTNLTTDSSTVNVMTAASQQLAGDSYTLDTTYNSLSQNATYLYRMVDPAWSNTLHDGLSKIVSTYYLNLADDMNQKAASLTNLLVMLQQTCNMFGTDFNDAATNVEVTLGNDISTMVSTISANSASIVNSFQALATQAEAALTDAQSQMSAPTDLLIDALVDQQYTLNQTYASTMSQLTSVTSSLSGLSATLNTALQALQQNATNAATYYGGTYTNSDVATVSSNFQNIVSGDESEVQNAYMLVLGPTDGSSMPATNTLAYMVNNNTATRTTSSQAVDAAATLSFNQLQQALYALMAVNQSVFQPLLQDLNNASSAYAVADQLFHNESMAAESSAVSTANASMALLNQTSDQVENALNQTEQILTGGTASLNNQFLTMLSSVALSQSSLINQLQQQMVAAQASTLGADSSRVAAVTAAFANAANYLDSSAQAGVNQMNNAASLLTLSQADIQSIATLFNQFASAGLSTNAQNLQASMNAVHGQLNDTTATAGAYVGALQTQSGGAYDSSQAGLNQMTGGIQTSANSSNAQTGNLVQAAYNSANSTYAISGSQMNGIMDGILASQSGALGVSGAASGTLAFTKNMTAYVNGVVSNGTAMLNSALAIAGNNVTQGTTQVTSDVVALGMNMVSSLTASASQLSQAGTDAAYQYSQNMSALQSLLGNSTGSMDGILTQAQAVVGDMSGELMGESSASIDAMANTVGNVTSFQQVALKTYQRYVADQLVAVQNALSQQVTNTLSPVNVSITEQIQNLEQSIMQLQLATSGLSSLVGATSTYGGGFGSQSSQLLQTFSTQLNSLKSQILSVIDAATGESQNFDDALANTDATVVAPAAQQANSTVQLAVNVLNTNLQTYATNLAQLFTTAMQQFNASSTAYMTSVQQTLTSTQDQANQLATQDLGALTSAQKTVQGIIGPVGIQIIGLNSSDTFANQVARIEQLLSLSASLNTSSYDDSLSAADSMEHMAAAQMQAIQDQSNAVVAQGIQAIQDNAALAAAAATNSSTDLSNTADDLAQKAADVTDFAETAGADSTTSTQTGITNLQSVSDSAADVVALSGDQIAELLQAFAAQQDASKGVSLNITSGADSVATVDGANAMWTSLRSSAVDYTSTSTSALRDMVDAVTDFTSDYTNSSVAVPLAAMEATEGSIGALVGQVNGNVTLNSQMISNIEDQVKSLHGEASTANDDFVHATFSLNATASSYVAQLRNRYNQIQGMANAYGAQLNKAAGQDILAILNSS